MTKKKAGSVVIKSKDGNVRLGRSLKEGVKLTFGVDIDGRTYEFLEKTARSTLNGKEARYYANLAKHHRRQDYEMIAEDMLRRTGFDSLTDKLIVDVGSGPGILTIELAKRISNSYVIGIDPSIDMIDISRECSREEGVINVEFISALAEDLPSIIGKNKALVVSRNTLHRIKDGVPIIRVMYEIAAMRGKPTIYIRDMNRHMPWEYVLEKADGWTEESKLNNINIII
ncbi:MAG: class I SAM-dependent methyltransferase [Nanoarchaeota archaeon]